MKSRTSFFNVTVFKKNLTRFAPAWGLCTVFMLMSLITSYYDNNRLPGHMVDWMQSVTVWAGIYAMVCAMLLFGDLFQSRMCNAMHALPIRRETWFVTNVISGLVFFLIPTAAVGILATALMAAFSYPMGWVTGPLWFLCSNLLFICFFGIAVFSVMCVGSRFAMAVVYGILNFGSMIAYWLADMLYVSQLYGIQTKMEPFLWFSPVGHLVEHPVANMEEVYRNAQSNEVVDGILTLGEGWGYLWIWTAVGLILGALALVLYRRRRLESAGDFLAIRKLEPVFLIVYTLCVGALFSLLMGSLLVGLLVGYFTGQMLLKRTVRVFQRKTFGKCAIVLALVFGSIAVVAWDPLGIEEWMPEKQDVEYVLVTDSHYEYTECEITLEEAADMEKVLAMHQASMQWHRERIRQSVSVYETSVLGTVTLADAEPERVVSFSLEYHLKNGRTVSRYYYIPYDTQSYETLKHLFSRQECVFGADTDVDTLMETHQSCYLRLNGGSEFSEVYFSGKNMQNLLTVILADCEAGTMAQSWSFHDGEEVALARVVFPDGTGIRIYSDCKNVLQWLESKGIDTDALIEELKK